LKDFQERFDSNGFIQIGKSMLINVYKVSHMKTDFNMKMQLMMENGETLVLNRAYKARFIAFLKDMEEGNHEANR
jgi:DNA-binding LytR/AlgR family response regulator